MSKVTRLKVVIDETVYELTSPDSHEYIQAVASYIDKKIKSIYSVKSEASMNPRLKTLFISLNIADDLFKEKEQSEELETQIETLREQLKKAENNMTSLRTQNKDLSEETGRLKSELEKVNAELDEYMEAFEVEERIKKENKVAKIKR